MERSNVSNAKGAGNSSSGRLDAGEIVQFLHQLWPSEQRGTKIKTVSFFPPFTQFSSGLLGGFKEPNAVPLRGQSNGRRETCNTRSNNDGLVRSFQGYAVCWSAANLSFTCWKQIRNQTVKFSGERFISASSSAVVR